MKKLLTLTAVVAILPAPAMAVQKCVALNESTTCISNTPGSLADWDATCTTNGTNVLVKGIPMCSNQQPTAVYTTSETLETLRGTGDTNNTNCWCKMISPAISHWVYVTNFSTASRCAALCSGTCGSYIYRDSVFQDVMFGSISD